MATIDVPFLIVGAGPVGLTAAHLLASQGRRCLVVERRDGTQRHPAAHAVNARTLEIFRQAGVDMEAVAAVAKDPADAGHVNFVTKLDGELIGRLPYERQGPEVLEVTPTPLRNISQHRLEPILAESVVGLADADLRYGAEWVSSEQDDEGVTSTIRDLATGDMFQVRSRWVLAADGAGSRVRKSLGIEMVGPPSLQSFIAIHFAANLRDVVAERPGVLHFVMDPEVAGVFVAHDVDREWVFMIGFDPDAESADDYDDQRCETIVRQAMGEVDAPIEILSAGSWHMSAQVADGARDGRIFLVGDAAHRFPPTGGMGLNTGVADVHGLIWKLLAIDDGWAGPALAESYEAERLPVAHLNCDQSTTNAFKMISLIEALALTESATTETMLTALADPERREAIDAAVEEQRTHFDMIGLQLGYGYADGALVREGSASPPIEDPSRFEPDGAVGTRLPHGWLDDGRSTLDVVALDGMTLLTAGAHNAWESALAEVEAPVTQVRLGVDVSVPFEWLDVCRLGADEALLVRPDQHIAWRSGQAAPDGATLAGVVDRVLGRTSS